MKSDPFFRNEKCYCRLRFSHNVSLYSQRKNLLISSILAVEVAGISRGMSPTGKARAGALQVGHNVMV